VRDWKKRAKQGMVEIFSAMTLQEASRKPAAGRVRRTELLPCLPYKE
jgi:hypothetical protein